MLLRHLGHDAAAARIEDAVEADMRENGASVRGTDQVGADVLARLWLILRPAKTGSAKT